ncbi:TonB-dependent receptor [Flavobacterium noncentrifugens]|uniref:TonB-dependent Receptor Plug Domain n=1 Tax=Flavobacterium noncentrifugens TaxID=1128970 RepID=A0A1G8RK51_9FLAO|nr:TonB-dependent receptor [Flavobacterium noncentrifugens]GEP49467.1 TonB-dependent receptor [Flavobacterium noncentrifugens]SDJ17293.1 TonB-dependent Receptor Plug Domain [Flavobacterium noncentrifugens]
MKKLLFLFLLVFGSAFAQQNDKTITVAFSDSDRVTAIQTIEKACGCRFYFDPEWLQKDASKISGDFKNAVLKDVLESVFNNTTINYLIDGDKVILTNNSIIYDRLPEGFFGSDVQKDSGEPVEKPVFQQQFDSIGKSVKNSNPVAFIGKESKKTPQKTYTLSGYIKDSKTGESVPNLNVRARGSNSSTTTDKEGFYSLQLPTGMNTIETESVNHKKITRKIVVYSNGNLDFDVEERIHQLEQVNIKSRKNQAIRTAVTGVTTIDAEGIKNIPLIFGERDILRVATSLPGIKTAGEGSAGFNVRGGKEDQNLFLLDNALLYNPAHFFGFFSALNPYTTKKVDIYKGSIPAEFGGRLSSVFDITTKNGDFDKFMGEGGIGPVTSNISLSTPIVKGKSSLLFGGRATYSGWILKQLDDESLKNSNAEFYDGIIKYAHKINDNNSIEATAYYSHDAFSISSDSIYKYSNRLLSVKWEHVFNEKNKGALILTNTEYKFGIDYQTTGLNSFDFGYKINETQAAIKMNYQFDKKHKITYGLSAKGYGIHPGDLRPQNPESLLVPVTIEKEKALESAVYIADSFKVNEKLLVDIGLRYSYYAALGAAQQRIYANAQPINDGSVTGIKVFKNNEVIKSYGGFEPRVAARYFLAEDFSVKAGYDKTYQYIHLLSSNTTQAPTDNWKLSDLNVKPQSAQQFSVGLYKNLSDDKYELSIEGYYKKSKNILDYKVGAELQLNQNVETELLQGEGKAYGVEFLLKKQIGRLNGWLGYTYSRTFIKLDSKFSEELVNNGKYFAANFDKPHDVSAVLNYKITKRYSVSTNFVYQTGRPITYPIGKYVYGNAEYTLYSDRNKFRIPDYYRMDIGLNIEGSHKIKKLAHSFWNISVYNVLGRNNPYSVYFVTNDGKIKAYKTSIFSVPVPTITYNFKF